MHINILTNYGYLILIGNTVLQVYSHLHSANTLYVTVEILKI